MGAGIVINECVVEIVLRRWWLPWNLRKAWGEKEQEISMHVLLFGAEENLKPSSLAERKRVDVLRVFKLGSQTSMSACAWGRARLPSAFQDIDRTKRIYTHTPLW